MSQERDDMVALRKEQFDRVESMRKIGDYGAGARDIRKNAEAILKLIDLALERMK